MVSLKVYEPLEMVRSKRPYKGRVRYTDIIYKYNFKQIIFKNEKAYRSELVKLSNIHFGIKSVEIINKNPE